MSRPAVGACKSIADIPPNPTYPPTPHRPIHPVYVQDPRRPWAFFDYDINDVRERLYRDAGKPLARPGCRRVLAALTSGARSSDMRRPERSATFLLSRYPALWAGRGQSPAPPGHWLPHLP